MKRKNCFVALAGALLLMGACPAGGDNRPMGGQQMNGGQMMNGGQQAFYNALSPESKRKFDSLDSMHRQKAMEMGGDPNNAVDMQYNAQKGMK